MHSRTLTRLILFLLTTFSSAQSGGLTPAPSSAAESLGSSIGSAAVANPSSLFSGASFSNQINSIVGTNTNVPTNIATASTNTASGSGMPSSTGASSSPQSTGTGPTGTASTSGATMSGSSDGPTTATATSSKPSSAGVGAQATAAVMAVGAGMMGVLGVAAML